MDFAPTHNIFTIYRIFITPGLCFKTNQNQNYHNHSTNILYCYFP